MNEAGAPEASPLDQQLLDASRLSDEGLDAEALQLLLDAEHDHPRAPTLLCMLGVLSAQLGSDGMAADFFRRCLAEEPSDPQLLVTAGAGLVSTGDSAAEPALRLAALTAPTLPAARLHYGIVLRRSGLVSQAIEELTAARQLDPDGAQIRRELGLALLQANSIDAALEELEAAAAADAGDAELRLLLGLALLQADEIGRAAEELHPLGEALDGDAEVQLIIALTLALAGWEEEGWVALSRAEGAVPGADPDLLSETEEAMIAGEEAVRSLLLDELAPSAFRDHVYRS